MEPEMDASPSYFDPEDLRSREPSRRFRSMFPFHQEITTPLKWHFAVNGDGLGVHEANDGGLLATVMSAGFKGELNRFQTGVTMEISRLDAWYSDNEGSFESPATYIVKGLCRRCCLPEIIIRCMQVSASLAESGESPDHHNKLIELVASTQSGMLQLFSQHQLQEFLLFERECTLYTMEFQEESSMVDA